ncbi:AI-2E family transporter [Succinimonas sp.]|uniref:AI-2E family transporter n=1 Tax=Succinimonas sp. TaxID=1936151 RepID=UPI00386D6F90
MFEFIKKWYFRNLSNPPSAVLLLQFITIFLLVYYGSGVFGPLIAALVLAFIFERPVSFLVRHGVSRTFAATIVLGSAALLVAGILFAVVPPAAQQITAMTQKIGIALNNSNTPASDIKGSLKEAAAKDAENKALNKNSMDTSTDTSGNSSKVSDTENPVKDANQEETPQALSENSLRENPEQDSGKEGAVLNSGIDSSTPLLSENQDSANSENINPENPLPDSQETKDNTASLKANSSETAASGNINEETKAETPASGNVSSDDAAEDKKKVQEEIDKAENDKAMSWITEQFNKIRGKLPESYQNIVTVDQLKSAVIYLEEWFKNIITPAIKQIAPIFMNTMSFITVYFLIVPIFAFFMLKDKDRLLNLIGHYCSAYDEVAAFWKEINRLISKYLIGNIIHIFIVAIINGIFLGIMGLNYTLLFAIGIGLSVLVPYVGIVIITIPLIGVGLMQFGLSSDMLILLSVYVVLQIVDAYVITPMLFSEALKIDTFSILVSVFLFGGIWGFWGIVLAIPLAVFIKTVVTMWPSRDPVPIAAPPEKEEDAPQS